MPSAIGSVVSGIGSIFGANEQVKGQKRAQEMFSRQKQAYNPFVKGGMEGFDEMQQAILGDSIEGYENFMQRPDIQYQIGQGVDTATQSLAGRGMLNSGRGLQELQGVGQDIAGQGYNQYVSNLGTLSNMGMTALDRQTGLTGQMADARIGVGQARAGRAQAIADTYSSFMGGGDSGEQGMKALISGMSGGFF